MKKFFSLNLQINRKKLNVSVSVLKFLKHYKFNIIKYKY